jgi:hypothetical protein
VVSIARQSVLSKEDRRITRRLGRVQSYWRKTHGSVVSQTFVDETGIDAPFVSIGNVRVLTSGTARVNLEALRRIRARVFIGNPRWHRLSVGICR